MVDWINANSGVVTLVAAPIIVALINLLGTGRDKAAANALKALEASNAHLVLLLEDSRLREANAKTGEGAAQRKCEVLEKDFGIVRQKVENLQRELSALRDRPCLALKNQHYIYAFPDPGDEDTAFCQACWDDNRVLTRLEYDKGYPPYTWLCPVHRNNVR